MKKFNIDIETVKITFKDGAIDASIGWYKCKNLLECVTTYYDDGIHKNDGGRLTGELEKNIPFDELVRMLLGDIKNDRWCFWSTIQDEMGHDKLDLYLEKCDGASRKMRAVVEEDVRGDFTVFSAMRQIDYMKGQQKRVADMITSCPGYKDLPNTMIGIAEYVRSCYRKKCGIMISDKYGEAIYRLSRKYDRPGNIQ